MDIKNIKGKIHRNRYNILLICILLFVGIIEYNNFYI